MRNYKKYEVYQMSMDLVEEIYQITKGFPDNEKYGLTSQIRRAAVSIPSNVAEGASRKSEKDFARYIEIAQGSSFEVETQLTLAFRVGYIQAHTFNFVCEKLQSIQRRLSGFRIKLTGKKMLKK